MEQEEKKEVYQAFTDNINMAPKELEKWLETEESQEVGWDSGDGESTGHKSGKRIVKLRRKNKDELTEDDYAHMRKVNGYIKRHINNPQKPQDIENSRWRYSLMNWGHDPCKHMKC